MDNQTPNTVTFEWLDDNLEPYCPGKDVCQRACDENCPIRANILGCQLFEEGKVEEAKELFLKAIDSTPDYKFGAAWTNLATICYNQIRIYEAFEAFKNAYCINQDNARAYEGLASTYASLKDFEKAITWCDKYAAKFGEEGIAKKRAKILKLMEENPTP